MSDTEQAPQDEKLSALYQATRTPEPSAALDAAIRTEARRALRLRRRRWILPLSSAALVLIGLSLALQVIELDRPPSLQEEAEEPAAVAPRSAAPEDTVGGRDKRVGEPVAAPAPPRLERPEQMRSRELDSTGFSQRQARPKAEMKSANESEASKPATTVLEAEPAAADFDTGDPDAWLRRIRSLLQDEQLAEARRELHAFRQQHPDYPLPDSLTRLLED